jgi:hypothetical protein
VSSVTVRLVTTLPTTAEGYFSTLLCLEDDGADSSLLATVATVAEGLVGTPATGAPGDCLTLFDLDDVRTLLARYRI